MPCNPIKPYILNSADSKPSTLPSKPVKPYATRKPLEKPDNPNSPKRRKLPPSHQPSHPTKITHPNPHHLTCLAFTSSLH